MTVIQREHTSLTSFDSRGAIYRDSPGRTLEGKSVARRLSRSSDHLVPMDHDDLRSTAGLEPFLVRGMFTTSGEAQRDRIPRPGKQRDADLQWATRTTWPLEWAVVGWSQCSSPTVEDGEWRLARPLRGMKKQRTRFWLGKLRADQVDDFSTMKAAAVRLMRSIGLETP